METHTIVSERFPYLEVAWAAGPTGREDWAYLDTGYTGFFIVPEALLAELGPPQFTVRLGLGDGRQVDAYGFWGSVRIMGSGQSFPGRILALSMEFLLGRQVTDRFKLTFDHGQRILVEL